MAEPFIGEIIMFGGTFAPRGWALCDGQLLQISQNAALFSILGTTYGGNGRTNFALPDLRGRVPMHPGTGPGLTPRQLGAKSGVERVSVTANNLPNHTHTLRGHEGPGNKNTLSGHALSDDAGNQAATYSDQAPNVDMIADSIAPGGGSASPQGLDNVQPFQCVNFIIALVGTFPPRN